MTRKSVLLIAFHGVLLVILGMVTGLPFQQAITADWGPEAARAWRVSHTSLLGVGTLYIALSAIASHLVLAPGTAAFATRGLVISAYALAFAFVVGPAIGARGLEPAGPPLHLLVFVLFGAALGLAFVALSIVLWGIWQAVRASE